MHNLSRMFSNTNQLVFSDDEKENWFYARENHTLPSISDIRNFAEAAIASHTNFLTERDITILDSEAFLKNSSGGLKSSGSLSSGGKVLSSYVSGDAGGYNIEIQFKGTWTTDLQKAFIDAAEKLSDIIVGDVKNVMVRGKIIDDIRIDATLKDIDGVNGILGQAGPTSIRTDGYLPVTATMEFDRADANALAQKGLWDEVILHEMIHSVGFGSIWKLLGLLAGAGTNAPLFTGANATHTYEELYGVTNASGVPVEQDGGAGTRDAHWDEQTFSSELMTGYLNPDNNFLSNMTIASLKDLGYDTTFIA